jgi:hypothetical protein
LRDSPPRGIGGWHRERHFFFVVEGFGGDSRAIRGFDVVLMLTSEK